jgi:hypothetical protein
MYDIKIIMLTIIVMHNNGNQLSMCIARTIQLIYIYIYIYKSTSTKDYIK